MMIVFSGLGFLVFAFVFGFSLLANAITNAVTGSGKYWDVHHWPFAASLFVSGIACWSLGQILRRHKATVLIDPQSGEQVVLRQSHTFFFIPMMWWGPILAACGLVALAMEHLK
jgi:hypothetical protein